MAGKERNDRPVAIRIGRDELVIRDRYEVTSIVNDILIAVWFIVGSVLFFYPDLVVVGTWCFVAGSVELLIRPLIRLSRRIHLTRFSTRWVAATHDEGQDF